MNKLEMEAKIKEIQKAYLNLYSKKLSVKKAKEMIDSNDYDILDEDYCNMIKNILTIRTANIKENKQSYAKTYGLDKLDPLYYYYNSNYVFDESSGDYIQRKRVCKECKKEFLINSLFECVCPNCGHTNDFME